MTLKEAIRFHTEEAEKMKQHKKVNEIILGTEGYKKALQEHTQLAEWLGELKERREQPEIIHCGECKHFQCNMRFDGSVPKGADAYECRHWCGGCDPMDYCSCGERAERRTDG